MRSSLFLGLVLATVGVCTTAAQEHGRYVLLAASRTATMQDEINDMASRGYRVVAASRSEGSEVLVALEQTAGSYQYRLLATTRTSTLQQELTDGAEAGYRVVPRAVTTKRTIGSGIGRVFGNDNSDEGELLIIMEKGPDTVPGLSYRVLATSRTGTLQREMSDTAAEGFELIGLLSRGEHLAIFERAEN